MGLSPTYSLKYPFSAMLVSILQWRAEIWIFIAKLVKGCVRYIFATLLLSLNKSTCQTNLPHFLHEFWRKVFVVISYYLTKFQCLVVFTLWDIGQYIQGLFQALMFTTVFACKIEFYSQFILVSDTQSAPAGKAVKSLGLEICKIAQKSTSRVKHTENISFFEVLL